MIVIDSSSLVSGAVFADEQLKRLRPDPSWDVSGLRDMVGGVVAVALVATVAVIILGCLSMMPGLVSGNMMERAFSWKRLLAALLVPFVIGAAVSGWGWSCNVFGQDGLSANRGSVQASGSARTDLKDTRGEGSDDLGGMVKQLGRDIASSIGDSVKTAVKQALSGLKGALDAGKGAVGYVTGGDGNGNIFQKAGQAIGSAASSLQKWLSGLTGGK